MKKVAILTLMIGYFCSIVQAQNGGQAPENNVVKIEPGYFKLGVYYVKVTNKLTTLSKIITNDFVTGDQEHQVDGHSFIYVAMPTNGAKIKAKNKTCSGTDCGWVEFNLTAMPLKFLSRQLTQISETELELSFEVAEVTNLSKFRIKFSPNGANYMPLGIVFPDPIRPNQIYKIRIDISNDTLPKIISATSPSGKVQFQHY